MDDRVFCPPHEIDSKLIESVVLSDDFLPTILSCTPHRRTAALVCKTWKDATARQALKGDHYALVLGGREERFSCFSPKCPPLLYSSLSNSWRIVASPPRYGYTTFRGLVRYKGFFYAYGNDEDDEYPVYTVIYRYDPLDDVWEGPTSKDLSEWIATNQSLFQTEFVAPFPGGIIGLDHSYLSTLVGFVPEDKTWCAAPIPEKLWKRNETVTAIINCDSSLYTIGYSETEGESPDHYNMHVLHFMSDGDCGLYCKGWQSVSPVTKAWSGTMYYPSCQQVGGRIFVFDDRPHISNGMVCEIYDPSNDSWTSAASGNILANQDHFTTASVGDCIFLIGGVNNDGRKGTHEVKIFDTSSPTGSWREGPSLPFCICGHVSA